VPAAITGNQASPRGELPEGVTPRDVRRSRKEPKGSRREPKVPGAKKTKRRTRKPTSTEGKQQLTSPLPSTSSEQISVPISSSDSPATSSVENSPSISSAPSTPTPSTPPSATAPPTTQGEDISDTSVPHATENFDDEQGLILVSCWQCEATSPWDNVSDFVVCTNCGEKSLLDFEEEEESELHAEEPPADA
jgi:hypothetical protein